MSSPRSDDHLAPGRGPLRLSSPVRCIWRPFWPGQAPPETAETVALAGALAEMAPLVVEVWTPSPWPQLPELPFAQVSLLAPPAGLSCAGSAMPVADLTPYGGVVPELRPGPVRAAAFLVSAATVRLLPAAVDAARRSGVEAIALPPLPFQLIDRIGGPIDSPSALSDLWRDLLAPALDRLRGIRIEPHDRFLLTRLAEAGLDVGSPPTDAGCQAATALIAVTPGGEVFPCPLWPVPLGTLAGGWDRIRDGEPMRSFLARFPAPAGCAGCRLWSRCLGGCPGAAAALGRSPLVDPLCPGAFR